MTIGNSGINTAVVVVFLSVLGFVACERVESDLVATTKPSAEVTAEAIPPIIPEDISYSIIDADIVPNIKRSINVRLNRKATEDVLRLIAIDLKSNDSQQYERTFMVYYLPGMEVGSGGWATTHFNPNLEVRIIGVSLKGEKKLVIESALSDGEVIGNWLSEMAFAGGRITIYRKDGKLYMEHKFEDGSSLKREMREKSTPSGQRFDMMTGSSSGDHYVIDQQGNLQIRDSEGLISIANRIP